MTRKIASLAAALMAALPATAMAAEDAEAVIDGGKAPLHGALLVPDRPRAGAAVLILPGSGPTDRDSNSLIPGVRPDTTRLLAQGLASQGITSLRIDKRGVGRSAAAMTAEQDLRFGGLVDDAVAWSRFLAGQPGVTCVVLAGHSEGALVATLAAERTPVCGLVLISGAGRTAADLLKGQMQAQSMPDTLRQKIFTGIDQLSAGQAIAEVPPELMSLFRPSVQPYMMSWLPIDPAAELAKVKAPALILQGETDLQVSVDDARRLAVARPDATLVLLDGVNHVLKAAPAERAANLATYADPRIVPAVAKFVKALGR